MYELGIIGAGNMAEAIARGVLTSGVFRKDQIVATDPVEARRSLFEADLGIKTINDPTLVACESEIILLAVKPQSMLTVLDAIAPCAAADATIVSIAAGITASTIESKLGTRPVVRTMPNTPLMVGLGAVAIAPGKHAKAEHLALARKLFESVGVVVEVREDQLDAVTALSGSGPAYIFYLVEQMTRAGVEMGLPPDVSAKLAAQTAYGAGKMLSGPELPIELRRKVTSPGGTTQAAIESMQKAKLDVSIVEALKAAQRRSEELGRG
jgi:pyrroline-5-carboxylate reductase